MGVKKEQSPLTQKEMSRMEVTGVGKENYEYFSPFTGELNKNQGVLGLIEDDYAVGAAVFTRDGDACLLDNIYVDPNYRRMHLFKQA